MSKQVEERVVSMEFNNSNFEKNVNQSMSTLEKLKQSLSFKGASKGFENISASAKNVNFSGMQSGIEALSSRFSALEVMGVTALVNITNSAVNAGKRIASALTIAPVIDGFKEYETQMNAVQTILANTQSKGTTIDDVNASLDELNTYADKTIYNFSEMAKNIGMFTAAGVDLKTSVSSIKGIANLAAMSGSNSQQAATAMYQLSQALAAGKVQLMDWNSVVNAGMGGEVFQNALKRTAKQMGYDVDAIIEKYGSFRESLTKGEWLTSEVLTETLSQLSGAYSEADLIAQGYTESQAKEIMQLAKTAEESATKVKTFTQLWDTMKEAVGSGWAQSWRIIIGDFEEARELLTGISDSVSSVINSFSERRNTILEGAFSSGWKQFSNAIDSAGIDLEVFKEKLVETGKEHGVVTDEMIAKAGGFEKSLKKGWANSEIVSQSISKYADEIDGLSDAQAKNLGYTDEQIKLIRQLAEEAKATGTPINDLIQKLARPSGRELLFESIGNFLQPIGTILRSIGEAWDDAFPPNPESLYNLISAIHDISERLVISEENADRLVRTFKGVFSVIDMVTSVLGGGFKLGLSIVSKVISTLWTTLGFANTGILEITATIGDAIVAVRDWFEQHSLINKAIEITVPLVVKLVIKVAELVEKLGKLPQVQNGIAKIKDVFSDLTEALDRLTADKALSMITKLWEKLKDLTSNLGINIDFSEIAKFAVEGLANGLASGVGNVFDAVAKLAQGIIDKAKEILDINSPSRKMEEVGKWTIEGLCNGIKEGLGKISEIMADIGNAILGGLKKFDFSKAFSLLFTGGSFYVIFKSLKIFEALSAPMEGAGKVLESFADILDAAKKPIVKNLKAISGAIKAFAFKTTAEGVESLAKAIAIMAGSIYVLSKIKSEDLWESIAAIAALSGVLVVVAGAIKLMNVGDMKGTFKLSTMLISLSAALLIMSKSASTLGKMKTDELTKGLTGLTTMLLGMVAIIQIFGTLKTDEAYNNIGKLGGMMLKLSVSLLLMVAVIKLISMLEPSELIKGGVAITAFIGVIALLGKVASLSGNIDKLGTTLLSMSASMLLMVIVIKMVSKLEPSEVLKGIVAMTAFVGFIGILSNIAKIGEKQQIAKLGATLISMSVAMMLMVGVIKLISTLKPEEIIKGTIGIAAFVTLISTMVQIVKYEGQIVKAGATILAMSVAVGILAGVAIMLSFIDTEALTKGIVAVSLLGSMVAYMSYMTQYARDIKGTMMAMAVVIGVMTASVVALSFIDPGKLAGAVTAISILIGVFSGMMYASKYATSSMGSIISMTVAIGLIAAAIVLVSNIKGEGAIKAVISISTLMLAMSATLVIINNIGKLTPTALVSIGVMTAVVAALGLILKKLEEMDPTTALSVAVSLSTLLLSMSAACLILTAVGAGGPAALIGVGSLLALVAGVAAVVIALGALNDKFPKMEEFLNTGIPILEKIGYALGSFFGNIIGGFSAGVTSGLPEIGTNLSNFMTNLQPFLDGAKGIDPTAMDGVQSLVKAIVGITAADLFNSITQWITGGDSMDEFASNLIKFGNAMKQFAAITAGVDTQALMNSSQAAQALVSAVKSIPAEGGFFQKLTGEINMDGFATNLVKFGTAMKNYATTIAGVDVASISNSAQAAQGIVNVVNILPKEDGFFQLFTGEINFDSISTGIVKFGTAMKNYAASVTGINAEAITTSVDAADGVVKMVKKIPKEGGFFSFFTGETDISSFGSNLVAFGKSLSNFSNSVATVGAGTILNAVTATEQLVSLVKSMKDIDVSGVGNFTSAMNTLAGANIKGAVSAIKSASGDMKSAGSSLISGLAAGIKGNTSAASAAKSVASQAAEAVKSQSSKFNSAGKELGGKVATGIKSTATNVKSATTSIVSGATSGLRSYYSNFYSAGAYVAQGFANGISSGTFAAAAKARAMAKAASEAAQKQLDEHSPSKVFYKIGDFAAQGFVNALGDSIKTSYRSGKEMAAASIDGLRNALSSIDDSITDNIDSTPTIRPVIDLSDVEQGASIIGSLLNDSNAIGLKARQIGSIVNRRQNGNNNNEVVSALKDLKKAVNNVGGTTYNVNGITYDDGSNVSDAVQTLIRAAKIERRV